MIKTKGHSSRKPEPQRLVSALQRASVSILLTEKIFFPNSGKLNTKNIVTITQGQSGPEDIRQISPNLVVPFSSYQNHTAEL